MRLDVLGCRRLLGAGFCAAIVVSAAMAFGQDQADWRDSAYCVGVLRHASAAVARLGAPADAQRGTERLAQRSALVRTALGRDGADAVAVRDLMALGRADAQVCWDQADQCFDAGAADLAACMQPVRQTCLRTSACAR